MLGHLVIDMSVELEKERRGLCSHLGETLLRSLPLLGVPLSSIARALALKDSRMEEEMTLSGVTPRTQIQPRDRSEVAACSTPHRRIICVS
jgi:hypothetical protein